MSKAQKILEYLNETPRLSDQLIAKRVGCTTDYVRKLCRKMAHVENEQGPPTLVLTELMEEANALLNARFATYGTFLSGADMAVKLQNLVTDEMIAREVKMLPDALLALDMIMLKVSRIVNGDPNYLDSWTDIAGYATLVADRIKGNIR